MDERQALLWQPSEKAIAAANLTAFRKEAARRWGVDLPNYLALHAWSVSEPEKFWESIWDFTGVIGEKGEAPFLINPDKMSGAQFFPQARLNFAQNLLRRRDDATALLFCNEGAQTEPWSWAKLYEETARLAAQFKRWGVGPGDRVAAIMPNMPETVAAMLAATSLGAVWSSCSPDFGVKGVLDRFGQIEPKILIACDGYRYNGKKFPIKDKLTAILDGLPSVEHSVGVSLNGDGFDGLAKMQAWESLAPSQAGITFAQLPFNHPLYIMFSSGTTGVPKCIVHGAGGTLLQHLKEHQLHVDIKPGERLFYFTTCGWMMWNWLVSGLASGATLALYDGSPFYPNGNVLFDYAQAHDINVLGLSAKFIDALKKDDLAPNKTHDLSKVRQLLSTGSPLAAESFDYVYDKVTPHAGLASMSGGTDIVSCFVLGEPTAPVWRGEIQAKGLGMAVDVWSETGASLVEEKGELVCTKPFPSMPIGFWNDTDGTRYHAAYFDRFDNVWCHGDFAEITAHGGFVIHGRSDATLNPGGVRIGTAEIYNQVETIDQVTEALAIGQEWEGDVRVVLFVTLRDGVTLDGALINKIKTKIRTGASPRHVPARIIAVADIPRTKSGKITELAVRDIVHGREVKNREALANPQALELFRELPDLKV